jgi:hypothetical protein
MPTAQHAPQNAMLDPGEIARFHDRWSNLMRELLDEFAQEPGTPRLFPAIEDAIGWPRRRIASVLGGVSHLRHTEFAGRRPYRFRDERQAAPGRWELWMDAAQAQAVRAAQRPSALRRDLRRRGGTARGAETPAADRRPADRAGQPGHPSWKAAQVRRRLRARFEAQMMTTNCVSRSGRTTPPRGRARACVSRKRPYTERGHAWPRS